ncbi:MAG: saccharopine dehydrogenase NADP-binding domain-containing protein [Firmicutes bacterium]|nr:saccharopine dehydrogenase NADP-binding domain-containing protein [Bacillota bacterium]
MKNILVLGAGLVARPLVTYLMNQPDFVVSVASRTVKKAEELVGNHSQGRAIALDVNDDAKLEELVAQTDLAVSLLPYTYHVKVARMCIKHKKHMVTTSYVSKDMASLDAEAKEAGIIILNEIGLDPGIDHMSAMKIIHQVQKNGGKITAFSSYCGGLPAPEANDNPFGYKFSWSPRGVLMAGKNNARFLKDDEIIEIPGKDLFDNYWTMEVGSCGLLEGYPNRDSIPYKETYGIEDTKTMFRGTFRNIGWCSIIKTFADLGMLLDTPDASLGGLSYKEFMLKIAGASKDENVKEAIAKKAGKDVDSPELGAMEWLGLFEDAVIPEGTPLNPMDILCGLMLAKMSYKEGERDMIILHHIFEAEYPEKGKKEDITATMIDYGIPNGDSSMARTVSLPAAIGIKLILTGKITDIGVKIPVEPHIYEPVMAELETMDIRMEEKFIESEMKAAVL